MGMGVDPKHSDVSLVLVGKIREGGDRYHVVAAEGHDAVRLVALDDRASRIRGVEYLCLADDAVLDRKLATVRRCDWDFLGWIAVTRCQPSEKAGPELVGRLVAALPMRQDEATGLDVIGHSGSLRKGRVCRFVRAPAHGFLGSAAGVFCEFEEKAQFSDRERWYRTTLAPFLGPDGSVTRIMAFSQDTTANKKLQLQMQEFALQDVLTGMTNRRAFDRTVRNAVAEATYSGTGFALCVVDLNNLKAINDEHGHRTGP